MKRAGNLYEKICDTANIELAYHNARRGKLHKASVVRIGSERMKEIEYMLGSQKFVNGHYNTFERSEYGKVRKISSLPFFPDRIIQHCIVQIIEPIISRTYITDTYASIRGRGIMAGLLRVKKALTDKSNTQYCLKTDIRKFYESIDHDVMKSQLRRIIKCRETLLLLDHIIDSAPGLPIGNYLSQHLANYYLTALDHYIKEQLHVKYYFRYCDDMVLLNGDKQFLHDCCRKIDYYLQHNLKLQLKSNYQVFPVSKRGIDFLGYRFFHTHTLVRKSVKNRMISTIANNRCNINESIASYSGWLKHADTYNLKRKYIAA